MRHNDAHTERRPPATLGAAGSLTSTTASESELYPVT